MTLGVVPAPRVIPRVSLVTQQLCSQIFLIHTAVLSAARLPFCFHGFLTVLVRWGLILGLPESVHPLALSLPALPPTAVSWYLEESALNFWC